MERKRCMLACGVDSFVLFFVAAWFGIFKFDLILISFPHRGWGRQQGVLSTFQPYRQLSRPLWPWQKHLQLRTVPAAVSLGPGYSLSIVCPRYLQRVCCNSFFPMKFLSPYYCVACCQWLYTAVSCLTFSVACCTVLSDYKTLQWSCYTDILCGLLYSQSRDTEMILLQRHSLWLAIFSVTRHCSDPFTETFSVACHILSD